MLALFHFFFGFMHSLLQSSYLRLQLLHLDFDKRGELSVELIHVFAIQFVLLIPFLDLCIAHYFLSRY